MRSWIFTAEPVGSPDAYRLRRDYYAEVAGRYWKRPATSDEIDQGLTGDGAELLKWSSGEGDLDERAICHPDLVLLARPAREVAEWGE
ncbi:hypothetical protein KRMM14A1004_45560 [Krasilnikovia sp. MM14-A1004]